MDLIKGITSDHQLIKLSNLLGVEITNIYTFEEIKKQLPKNGNYIILLENGGGIGHWTAIYKNEYFDSMGEPPPLVLGIKKYNKKQYQSTYAEYCGIWCMLWLYAKQNNLMDLFDGFHNLNNSDFE